MKAVFFGSRQELQKIGDIIKKSTPFLEDGFMYLIEMDGEKINVRQSVKCDEKPLDNKKSKKRKNKVA